MVAASPTIVTLATDSAWVVIVVVSLVTFPAVLVLRRVLDRPGGFASGLLVFLPLLLPILAAVLFAHGVLPEFEVLRPVGAALAHRPAEVFHLLVLPDRGVYTPYAVIGSAGPWLLLIGVTASSFMLLRRSFGMLLVRRLVRRCDVWTDERHPLEMIVTDLAAQVGLRKTPQVLVLPQGVSGAFVVGGRGKKILVSRDLVEALDKDELEAILAHEVAHLRARDVGLVLLAGILRDMVAWNPLAHVAFRKLVTDRELEADRRAAALTGRPLAVASGLLTVCALVKANSGAQHRAALAAYRPGGRLARRVSSLIAVADGRTTVNDGRVLPYAVAALMVAVLGLQAGSRLAADRTLDGLAIVWGGSGAVAERLWAPGRDLPDGRKARAEAGRQRTKPRERAQGRLGRNPALASSVRPRDWARWLARMDQWARSKAVPPASIRWEERMNWWAEPLIEGGRVGPFGVYRIRRLSGEGWRPGAID